MGGGRGRNRSRTQRKHFSESRENVWKRSKSDSQQDNNNDTTNKNSENKTHWEPFSTQNPAFDEYYKEQEIVSAEEWDTYIQFLRKPLPAAFRINSSSQFCADIRSQLENDFMKSLQVTEEGEVSAIRPLPWYPNNLAWHSNFSRMQLRKNQTLERFHEFLKQENEIGNITRQEAVSMVPPLFLDVSPDHFVLDMCAAPGSKTFQLLEMIHQSTESRLLPSAMVIANDVDVQRCNLLIHQTKRMCTANLMVTNHEAQNFPSCHLNKNYANASETDLAEEPNVSQILFDRVLCDVPCSGDGTLRKAPDIWRKWNPGMGNGLHTLQVLIAMRGLSLLKIGGRMVYSTCSMNPVENEAVVAEILRRCGASVELIDVSSEIPQLVRRPGLKKWKVRDKGIWFTSHKDVPKFRKDGIFPSMFPSGKSGLDASISVHNTGHGESHDNGQNCNSENGVPQMEESEVLSDTPDEEVSTFPLERCMRIVPHDQNTGAFFIAVFHKLSPLPGIQKKSFNLKAPSLSSINTQKAEEKQDTDLVEVSPSDVTVTKLPESASEADIVDEVEEITLDTDAGEICETNEAETIKNQVGVEPGPEIVRGKRKLQIQGKWKGVDPVVFFKDDNIVNGIKTFYGIDDSFPFSGHLVTRNSDTNHVKRIYYISKSVKDILELNFQSGQQLKITSIGMKIFERQTSKEGTSSPCAFRISSEGLPLLLSHITKQILCASPVDFKHLLQYKSIKFTDFVDAEFGEKASKLMMGCCVMVFKKEKASKLMMGGCVMVLKKGSSTSSDPPQVDASTIAIGCWKGRTNIAVMVTAIDCQELLERLLVRMDTEKESVLPENGNSSVGADELEKLNDNDHSSVDANESVKLNGAEYKEDMETMEVETVG